MGLSIAISGGIVLSVMLLAFMTIPGFSEKIVSIGEFSTESMALATTIQDNYSSSQVSTIDIEISDDIRSGDKIQ